jgi:drug/metabolite transporter (DMT)-like permease
MSEKSWIFETRRFPLDMQTVILGLSSSLLGALAYSYIVSLGYFTPAVGIVAGLLGSSGMAVRDLFYEKERKYGEITLIDILRYVLFGIIAIVLGYVIVYYFVRIPAPGPHSGLIIPREAGTIYEFFKQTLTAFDIIGAALGAICTLSIPMLFGENIRKNLNKLKK